MVQPSQGWRTPVHPPEGLWLKAPNPEDRRVSGKPKWGEAVLWEELGEGGGSGVLGVRDSSREDAARGQTAACL